jgi:hypothetical protein
LDTDVGVVGPAGSASYTNGTFTVNGAGNYPSTADAFHFVYQPLSGDGGIVARVVSMPAGTGAVVGITIRETLNPGSVNGATFEYSGHVQFFVRTTTGGSTSTAGGVSYATPPYWVELVPKRSTWHRMCMPD